MEAQEAAKAADPGALKFDSITPAEIAAIKSTVRELGTTDTVSGVSTLSVDKVDLRLNADGLKAPSTPTAVRLPWPISSATIPPCR